MAPGVDLTICATPPLPSPARAVDGHLMVESLPSVQALPAASWMNRVKFAVVPEESDRTARVIGVLGRLTPELSALIAGSFQVLILPEKMPAIVEGDSFRLLTPDRLYAIVIGPMMTGKYRIVLPVKPDSSLAGMGESEPANWTVPAARSVRPLPEPPPPQLTARFGSTDLKAPMPP